MRRPGTRQMARAVDSTESRPPPTLEQFVEWAAKARALADAATTEAAREIHLATAIDYDARITRWLRQ